MTETESTAQAVAHRMSAITERLRSALNDADQSGFPQFDDGVSADAVRDALRSLDALRSDLLTGVEVLPSDVPNSRLTMAVVAQTVSEVFEVPITDFITPHRVKKRSVQAQRATAHLIRSHIPIRSVPDIARFMKKHDHSTILHTIKNARVYLGKDVEFANLVAAADFKLKCHA